MPSAEPVIALTRETLPVFLSIFGDLSAAATFRGQRQAVRRPSRCKIEFLRVHAPGNPELCRGQCVDISEDGIGFRCRDDLRVGERIDIFLPGESTEYSVRARVVHAAEKAGYYRIGAQFVWDKA